jgi:hypothetical protein
VWRDANLSVPTFPHSGECVFNARDRLSRAENEALRLTLVHHASLIEKCGAIERERIAFLRSGTRALSLLDDFDP